MTFLAALLPALTLAACGTSAQGKGGATAQLASVGAAKASFATSALSGSSSSTSSSSAPCGPSTPETLAQTVGLVAKRIYQRELASTGVSEDQRQVEGYGPLLSALASGNRASITEAVHSLVYSHTHIVRLRITQGSTVLADIGGPYILAPVGGELRSNGKTVGHYLLSVQDDLGFVKLETRYIGAPLVLHMGSTRVPLEGTLAPGPASIPDLGPVTYMGASYEAVSFDARAFPQGTLRISLLVPLAGSPAAGSSCSTVRTAELDRIAQRTWNRFSLVSAPPSAYVKSIADLTESLSYVRSNAHQLAGSTTPGPAHLPNQGTVKYHGSTWQVSSFASNVAAGAVRVYLLVR